MEIARAVRPCLSEMCLLFVPVLVIFWWYLMFSLALSVWQCKDAGQQGGPSEYERDLEQRKLYQDI